MKTYLKKITLAVGLAGAIAATGAQASPIVVDTAYYGGHTYQLLSADTWTNSETFAVGESAHLVTVNDALENAFLVSAFGIGSNSGAGSLWIGYYRTILNQTSAPFAWSSGSTSTYTNWNGVEPNNAGGQENYTQLFLSGPVGEWNDIPNVTGYFAPVQGVVEIDHIVPEPASLALLGLGLAGLGFSRRKQA